MKSDTERKRFYNEKLHKRKNRLHVHLSKELRSKLKTKKRAVLLHKNDRVKIMRGPQKGKETKVSRVSVIERKVYLEGIVVKTSRGREVNIPLEPSNLLIIGLEPTEERKSIFKEEAFKKEEKKVKAEAKAEKAEEKPVEQKVQAKPEVPRPEAKPPATRPASVPAKPGGPQTK